MLVLSRRQRESVVINDDIVITVVKIGGNKVHLAFEAPRTTPILRQEIFDAIASDRVADELTLELAATG